MHIACTPTNPQPRVCCGKGMKNMCMTMYVQCKGFGQLSVSVWVSVFALTEDAAWKTLAVLESRLPVWLNITSGEKG